MPIAATDEQLALQASIRDWAKRAGTLALVRGQEPGPDSGNTEPVSTDPGGTHRHGRSGRGRPVLG